MASIVAADLVPYLAANTTAYYTDGTAAGGAVDTLRRPTFTQMTANSALELVAAGANTNSVTVVCRNAAGSVVSQTVTMNGTTAVALGTIGTAERILYVEVAVAATNAITLRNTAAGTTWVTIPTGERGAYAIFQQGASSTTATVTYYSKFFWRNTNTTNALLGASVIESADPTGLVAHGLETSVGGANTATNRVTAPGTTTAFASTAVTLATATGTADLASLSSIGVWLQLSLAINNPAIRSTYTSGITGSTT